MPLTFDLPWSALQTYTGRSPRPADFDAYWNRALLELGRTEAKTEIILALPDIDPARVATLGGSQGGALALVCAALVPRIHAVAATYPFLSDYKRVWEMDLATGAYAELQAYFRQFNPLHDNEEAIFNRLGYIDVQNFTSHIQAEVLWTMGLADKVCPPSTQFAGYNKLSAPKSMRVYPDYGHENLPGADDAVFSFFRSKFC